MGWKRWLMESFVWCAARVTGSRPYCLASPDSIFILRNNDIGDLLVVTPLFEALRKRFPKTRILAGIGAWNADVLKGNPHVTEVLTTNAPWHNQQICHGSNNNLRGMLAAVRYIVSSPEVDQLRARRCEVGIDVLGSPQGSLLLLRAGIPYRLGVKGYAGGDSASQQYILFRPEEHVGRSALRFAELLGATDLPENRPQIFLRPDELDAGERYWCARDKHASLAAKRIVIGPGGGFAEKRWPLGHFTALTEKMSAVPNLEIVIAGGQQDVEAGQQLCGGGRTVRNLAGQLTLRQTFSLIATADLVLCNSSMLMHVAAAFHKPSVVVLGNYYVSAPQHAMQWGYPKTTLVLGKDADRPEIYSPAEVFDRVRTSFLGEVASS